MTDTHVFASSASVITDIDGLMSVINDQGKAGCIKTDAILRIIRNHVRVVGMKNLVDESMLDHVKDKDDLIQSIYDEQRFRMAGKIASVLNVHEDQWRDPHPVYYPEVDE